MLIKTIKIIVLIILNELRRTTKMIRVKNNNADDNSNEIKRNDNDNSFNEVIAI